MSSSKFPAMIPAGESLRVVHVTQGQDFEPGTLVRSTGHPGPQPGLEGVTAVLVTTRTDVDPSTLTEVEHGVTDYVWPLTGDVVSTKHEAKAPWPVGTTVRIEAPGAESTAHVRSIHGSATVGRIVGYSTADDVVTVAPLLSVDEDAILALHKTMKALGIRETLDGFRAHTAGLIGTEVPQIVARRFVTPVLADEPAKPDAAWPPVGTFVLVPADAYTSVAGPGTGGVYFGGRTTGVVTQAADSDGDVLVRARALDDNGFPNGGLVEQFVAAACLTPAGPEIAEPAPGDLVTVDGWDDGTWDGSAEVVSVEPGVYGRYVVKPLLGPHAGRTVALPAGFLLEAI
jgi:hypothetical protein